MIDPGYMLAKPTRPSPAKVFLDNEVIPALIDAAGGVEAVVERIAVEVRRRPAGGLAVAFLVGCGLGLIPRGPRPGRRT